MSKMDLCKVRLSVLANLFEAQGIPLENREVEAEPKSTDKAAYAQKQYDELKEI